MLTLIRTAVVFKFLAAYGSLKIKVLWNTILKAQYQDARIAYIQQYMVAFAQKGRIVALRILYGFIFVKWHFKGCIPSYTNWSYTKEICAVCVIHKPLEYL